MVDDGPSYDHVFIDRVQAKLTLAQLQLRVLLGWEAGLLTREQAADLLDIDLLELYRLREDVLYSVTHPSASQVRTSATQARNNLVSRLVGPRMRS
jgi:hypothetical protein